MLMVGEFFYWAANLCTQFERERLVGSANSYAFRVFMGKPPLLPWVAIARILPPLVTKL